MTRSRRLFSAAALLCLLLASLPVRAAETESPFCTQAGCAASRQALKSLCDYIVKEKRTFPTIYIGGYYMRTLVAGYEIFRDQQYLDTAVAYGDYLLAKQMPNGFWRTGYGPVYMADTGSAITLLIVLYPHVDATRQHEYLNAVQHYVDSIQADGMIHRSGALGTGWHSVNGNQLVSPIYDQYTLSSALTGGEIFTWMYHVTGKNKYREIADHALRWVLSTMRPDGNIPHILAMEGMDWNQRQNPAVAEKLWNSHAYGTSAYVGEGIIAFDLYCGDPAWQKWIERAVRPNIEFLLRTQLADGTWSTVGQKSWDRTRSPGIVDYLIWYYDHVNRDPRILTAVHRFDAFVTNPANGKSYGLLEDGADTGPKDVNNSFNTVTSLTGRALADIISPGVDARW
ncbi:MAG TPA: hypothetical protein VMD25_04855 [Acidobacteriaceae bacterium]|nr:hypothetical protein [Acidobacteriaceae bacterium]